MKLMQLSLQAFLDAGKSLRNPDSPRELYWRALDALGSTWRGDGLSQPLEVALQRGTEEGVPVDVDHDLTVRFHSDGSRADFPVRTLMCHRWLLGSDQLALVAVRDTRFDHSRLVWAVLLLDPAFVQQMIPESLSESLSPVLLEGLRERLRGYQALDLGVDTPPSPDEIHKILIKPVVRQVLARNPNLGRQLDEAIAAGADRSADDR